uniref:C-type lectin domain-containing protein n=1 Tax=Echeneis naucrates TaxID=173247 RepID=A0A665UF71_ECHNA
LKAEINFKYYRIKLNVDYPCCFRYWMPNQPDNWSENEHCGQVVGSSFGQWNDENCNVGRKYICKHQNRKFCDLANGWMPHGSNCYKLKADTTKSWSAARYDCVQDGGDLVIHSQEEEEFLSTYTKGSSKWIGLKHNPTEGGYSWSDGTPLSHTNWGSGEPNNHDNREECVEMVSSTNGTISWWNDLNCDAHQDWICMIAKGKNPVIPPVPPSPVPGEMSTSILVLKF